MRQCILCRSKKTGLLYKEKRLSKLKIRSSETHCTGEIGARGRHDIIWKCKKCGLVFQNPSFSEKELNNAYEGGSDERYFEQEEQRKKLFTKALKQISLVKYLKKPKVLDVGAGAGLFVSVAKENGWNAQGLEPSLWASRIAKKRLGVKVLQGTFEKFRGLKGSYDVITMWDVLEHYLEPDKALEKANKLLKKDGLIALTTINIDSWFSKLLGSHWTWLIRIHLWYFTPETLTKMLQNAGFEVEWTGSQVRWFSLPYLLSRFSGRDFSRLPKIILPAPTNDIIFVIARKK